MYMLDQTNLYILRQFLIGSNFQTSTHRVGLNRALVPRSHVLSRDRELGPKLKVGVPHAASHRVDPDDLTCGQKVHVGQII